MYDSVGLLNSSLSMAHKRHFSWTHLYHWLLQLQYRYGEIMLLRIKLGQQRQMSAVV